jgi:hypothetical protein
MKKAADDTPETGESARKLGARPEIDIPLDYAGDVEPGVGGMSVSPDSPENLPRHRRPPEYGGTGLDPVWMMDSEDLSERLVFRPDPGDPHRHGFVEPETRMVPQIRVGPGSDTRSSQGRCERSVLISSTPVPRSS